MKFPPFIKIPFLEAAPIPAKKLSGTEITKAQGQETTRKIQALSIQFPQSPNIKLGIIAKARAAKTTIGV